MTNIESELFWAILSVLIVVGFVLIAVPPIIWWERRLLGWMQDRIGPNRVGPFGFLQPIADGVKLLFKEDFTPRDVDRLMYFLSPAIALLPAFVIGATIPWGPNPRLTPIADVDVGVLWVLAISSLGVYGIVLGGWASNNKYSLLGGLRSSAQLVSYELPMGVALYSVLLPSGTLRLTEVVSKQQEALWGRFEWFQNWFILTPFGLISAVIFLICMVAETNRAPFDLPEAESELIAGYHTEYSSMKFAVFFMGEYAAMVAFSGLFAVLYLGGWSLAPLNWEHLASVSRDAGLGWLGGILTFLNGPWMAPIWFLGKVFGGVTFYIWLRATLPRLRYDQLMNFCWKYLLPAAAANFVLVAIGMLYGWLVYAFFLGILLVVYMIFVVVYYRPRAKKATIELVKIPANTSRVIEIERSVQ